MHKYLNRISGPLLDRIDLHVEVTPVKLEELSSIARSEGSAEVRKRVMEARQVQLQRYGDSGIHCNAQMNPQQTGEMCALDASCQHLLNTAMKRLGLSARAYERIIRVSRTIADLAACEKIQLEHIAEAIQFRSLDRENWTG